MRERRLSPRVSINAPADFLVLGESGVADTGVVKDIGWRGCRIKIGRRIPRGTIDVTLYLPGARRITCRGEISWQYASEMEGLSAQVGVCFRQIDPSDLREIQRLVRLRGGSR
ncbi:MAG: PilZ domain-containing protein [Nitrospirae bacterium]|nr:PilZ domain-containing protein [Nitrospirota bacterium]MBI3391632.1 PilZ domain-containing protein [Nitrospirota bacterium]